MPAKTHYIFVFFLEFMYILQGRCRLLRSGKAMERRRRSLSVGITCGGGKYIPFVKGGLGVLPKKMF